MVDWVVEALQEVCQRVFLVGSEVPDRYPGQGPLGGLVTALEHGSGPWLFCLACDFPLVRPQLLRSMVLQRHQGQAVVPRLNGRSQPLLALYSKACSKTANRLFDTGVREVRRVAEEVTTVWLDEAQLQRLDPGLESFLNVNRPEELERAHFLMRVRSERVRHSGSESPSQPSSPESRGSSHQK